MRHPIYEEREPYDDVSDRALLLWHVLACARRRDWRPHPASGQLHDALATLYMAEDPAESALAAYVAALEALAAFDAALQRNDPTP